MGNSVTRLYLCGFMGSGKTFAGKLAAEKSKAHFTDLDKYIESANNRTIAEIFAVYGEEHFRGLESRAIAEVSRSIPKGYDTSIIALGGGAVIKAENAAVIKESGVLVFIDVDFDICYERIKDDPERPIAREKSRGELETLYNGRKRLYVQNAERVIDGNTDVTILAERIADIFRL